MKERILILVLINCLATLQVFCQNSTDQLKLSLLEQQLKDPAGIEFKAPQSYAEVIECFPMAILSHPSTNFTSAAISSADPEAKYLVATKISGSPMTLCSLCRVWGLRLWYNGGWAECFEDPMELEYGFWEDDNGEPGALIYSMISQVTPTYIGETFAGFPLWQWDAYIPVHVCLVNGWFTVQATANNTNCWWLWVNAPDYPGTGLQWNEGVWTQTDYPFGFCFSGWNSLDHDVRVSSIISPSSGQNLGIELVEVTIKNEGTYSPSDVPLFYTLNNGPPVTEIYTGILYGEVNYTFSQPVDLTDTGTYVIEACTDLVRDQNPYNDCTTKTVVHEPTILCVPIYTSGCSWGDGLTYFDIDNQINNATGCENNTGYLGFSTYYNNIADIFHGLSYNVTAQTGYSNNYFSVWIDFNDDYIIEESEKVLDCGHMPVAGVNYTFPLILPPDASTGTHLLRARAEWENNCPHNPCDTMEYGEAEDYLVNVIDSTGFLEGYVYEYGTTNPIDGATVEWMDKSVTTNASGFYTIQKLFPGTATAYSSHSGYCIDSIEAISIIAGQITVQNFVLTKPEIVTIPEPFVGFNVVLDTNEVSQKLLKIKNPGSCELEFNIQVTEITKLIELDWIYFNILNGNVSPGDSTSILLFIYSLNYPVGTIKTALIEIINNTIYDTISMMVTMTVQSTIKLDLKVFLEGAFDTITGNMNTHLYNGGLIPLTQPYCPPLPYYGNPMPDWYYTGIESVTAVIPDVVDWILVDICDAIDATSATPSTTIYEFPAFLKNDGAITTLNFISNPVVPVEILEGLFVVIHHRNHISIMNPNPIPETAGVYSYDFTNDGIYGSYLGAKEISAGVWVMMGGDGNADKQVNTQDKLDVWHPEAGWSGYLGGDYDMSGLVGNQDKIDVWVPNSGQSSQVPD
ncbi:MAG: carboxypeptidase-like regulatory domain-containing protein [Bacteroidales bacterium]|nr:carboxypeptidase-like regulatory domain-containing protein [Bacteroidales bacterium]